MRAIVIAHWMVQMLQLDGTAAASEALQAQVALLTERDSGLFQVRPFLLSLLSLAVDVGSSADGASYRFGRA